MFVAADHVVGCIGRDVAFGAGLAVGVEADFSAFGAEDGVHAATDDLNPRFDGIGRVGVRRVDVGAHEGRLADEQGGQETIASHEIDTQAGSVFG